MCLTAYLGLHNNFWQMHLACRHSFQTALRQNTQKCSIVLDTPYLQQMRFCYLQILPLKAKPLSSFTNEEGLKLLLGPNHSRVKGKFTFPMADLDKLAPPESDVQQATGLKTFEDLLAHLGADLALRCLRSEPREASKEYAKREYISPILYIATVLAGELLNYHHNLTSDS